MLAAEMLPPNREPFREPLEEGEINDLYTRITNLPNNDNFVIRAEPLCQVQYACSGPEAIAVEIDWSEYHKILLDFEKTSGLKVAPYWDVIGESPSSEEYSRKTEQPLLDGHTKAVFHVVQKVSGKDVYCDEDDTLANRSILPHDAARLTRGIFDYHVDAYENNKPHVREISEGQFVFGTIPSDPNPTFYMVDVDYSLSEGTSINAVFDCIEFYLLYYMKSYGANEAFRPAAIQMLDFISRATGQSPEQERIENEIKKFIYELDHLKPVDTARTSKRQDVRQFLQRLLKR